MSAEHMKARIENAIALLQIITEDVESSFIKGGNDSTTKSRANMTVSSLYVLSDFLRNICEEVPS